MANQLMNLEFNENLDQQVRKLQKEYFGYQVELEDSSLKRNFTTHVGNQISNTVLYKNTGKIPIPAMFYLGVKMQSGKLNLSNQIVEKGIIPGETVEMKIVFTAPSQGDHWAVFQLYDNTGEPLGEELSLIFSTTVQTYEQKVNEMVPIPWLK